MTTQPHSNEQNETIIRFSGTWWSYLVFRLGFLRAIVNGVEDALTITGRFLLLMFLIYCGAEAGILLSDPNFSFPAWLQMTMFCAQLAGLEGSIPGLARQADTFRAQSDEEAAKKVEAVMISARVMTVLSITEGALHALHVPPLALQIISAILLVVRGVVITGFLVALAKIESKAPRILSKDAHVRELEQQALRDEQARTITDLRSQLDHTLETLRATERKVQQQVRDFETALQQKQVDVEQVTAGLQTAHLHIADLQTAVRETAHLQEQCQHLSANLQTANLQIADVTAKLERAKAKLAEQHHPGHAEQPGTPRPARMAQPRSDQLKITSIDEARARHDGSQGRTKLSHADVIAFMAANPDLKRAEVAERLSISERKVYDAIAWQREQEKEQEDAASAN